MQFTSQHILIILEKFFKTISFKNLQFVTWKKIDEIFDENFFSAGGFLGS
jgi:hypothetical protein